MANYQTKDIRNIALMGHGSEGKTTLTEALLFAAESYRPSGHVWRTAIRSPTLTPKRIKRRHFHQRRLLLPSNGSSKMINIVDVPGYFDFIGEAMGPLRVVETAVYRRQRLWAVFQRRR